MGKLINKLIITLTTCSLLCSNIVFGAQAKYNIQTLYNGKADAYGRYVGSMYNDLNTINKMAASNSKNMIDSKEVIIKMSVLGIMNGSDKKFRPSQNMTKEEAIQVIDNLCNIDASIYASKTSTSKVSYSAWADKYMQAAVANKIITSNDLKQLNFQKPVTRQEFAYWLACALKLTPVKNTTVINMLEDGSKIKLAYANLIDPLLIRGVMWNTSEKKFNPTGSMTRLYAANVINQAFVEFSNKLGYSVRSGRVADIVKTTAYKGKKKTTISEIFIRKDDGKYFELKEYNDGNVNYDFLVYKNKSLGFIKTLKTKDYVDCLIKDSKVVYVNAYNENAADASIEGTIDSIGNSTLSVQTASSKYINFDITDFTEVFINNVLAKTSDLLVGQDVQVKYRGQYVKEIRVSTPQYDVTEENETITGTVESLDSDTIQINSNGSLKEFGVSSEETQVYKGGNSDSIFNVKLGDLVKLTVNSDDQVESLVLEGYGGEVESVIKAALLDYNETNNSIRFKDIKKLVNSAWISESGQQSYNLAVDAQIFINGSAADDDSIKNCIGKEVYAVIVNDSDDTVIQKVNIKTGKEISLSDKINDVNLAYGKIKALDGTNMNIDDGTIIVYNDKLVSKDVLAKGNTAFMGIDQRSGVKVAGVISIVEPSINNLLEHYKFYMGKLDSFGSNSITISLASQFANNTWSGVGDSVTINSNSESNIYDSVLKANITYKAFMSGNYVVDSISSNGTNNWYAYVITDDNNNLQGMYLMKGAANLYSISVRSAIVTSVSDDSRYGKIMLVTEPKEWNSLSSKWKMLSETQSLTEYVSKSFVFKNGELTTTDSLEAGDTVLYISDGQRTCIFAK